MDINEYTKQTIGELEMPIELMKLFEFENKSDEMYSESFYLYPSDDDEFKFYFDFDEETSKKYSKSILVFAKADGTGGFLAFWLQGNNKELKNAPIINYGSEGDIQVVAKNIRELMQILTFDVELMDGSCYKSAEYYEESPRRKEYISWLKKEFDISPVDDVKEGESETIKSIIMNSQKTYKIPFEEWHAVYYKIE